MYVAVRNVRGPRLGAANTLRAFRMPQYRRLGGLRAREQALLAERFAALGYDDSGGSSVDWSQILTTGLNDASAVAKVALQPVPSVRTVTPYGTTSINYPVGTSSAQLLAGAGIGNPFGTSGSLFSSPLILLLIGGVVLVVAMGGSR